MCTERKNQIIRDLEANLSSDFKHSNNYELEEALDKIVQGMCEIVFEKTHAECRTVKDLKDIIWQITYDSKDVDERQLMFLDQELSSLHTYFKIVKCGNNGERKASKELEHLSVDGLTTIIKNITLKKDQDEIAEYDDLVISPNGIFIIEVKNIKSPAVIDKNGDFVRSDCERVNYSRDARRRKFVLREALKEVLEDKEMFCTDINVEEILLWTNDYASLDNQKPQTVISKRVDEVCDYIEEYPCRKKLDATEIGILKEALMKLSVSNEYPIKDVNVKSLYEKFAYVIATYENERLVTAEKDTEFTPQVDDTDMDIVVEVVEKNLVEKIAIGVGTVVLGVVTGYLGGRILDKLLRK